MRILLRKTSQLHKKDLSLMRFAIDSVYNYRQKQRRTGRICGRKSAEQGRTPVGKGRKSQKSRRTEPIRADFLAKTQAEPVELCGKIL